MSHPKEDVVTMTKEGPNGPWHARVELTDSRGQVHVIHGQGNTADLADHDLLRDLRKRTEGRHDIILPKTI